VTAHALHHADTAVRARGGDQAVDTLHGGIDRSVKTKGHVGGIEVVVNCLGTAHNRQLFFQVQLCRHSQSIVPAGGHQSIQAKRGPGLFELRNINSLVLIGIGA
jgi:hypothetical protein